MDYIEQLQTPAWKQKRKSILHRDKFNCQNCNNVSFKKNLRCGYAISPYFSNQRAFNHFTFLNVNSPIINYPRVILRISTSLLLSLKEVNPTLFWLEYVDNLERYEAEICFISSVNYKQDIEITNHLQKSIKKEKRRKDDEIPIINEFIIPAVEAISAIEVIPRAMDINQYHELFNNENIEYPINPYFNSDLFSIGKMLPICFAPKLNIHHKVYRENKLAWEYPDSDLITLCWSCHEELHNNTKIQCFSESGEYKGVLTPCSRCFGAGWFPEYKHVQNGICFRCGGKRYDEFLLQA